MLGRVRVSSEEKTTVIVLKRVRAPITLGGDYRNCNGEIMNSPRVEITETVLGRLWISPRVETTETVLGRLRISPGVKTTSKILGRLQILPGVETMLMNPSQVWKKLFMAYRIILT